MTLANDSDVPDAKFLTNGIEIDHATEWEEYDGQGKFWHHCCAGATAGVAEHLLMYPFDTIKAARGDALAAGKPMGFFGSGAGTAGAACPRTAALPFTTIRGTFGKIVAEDGLRGLYRGVSAMAYGCVPAHIGYFTAYEKVKELTQNRISSSSASPTSPPATPSSSSSSTPPVHHDDPPASSDDSFFGLNSDWDGSAWASGAAAGCCAAFAHDLILTPYDVAKQRMQLSTTYSGCMDCMRYVRQTEGFLALYRSFPIALMSNVPYTAVLIGCNEQIRSFFGLTTTCKTSEEMWQKLPAYFGIAGFSSAVAAVVTQPLDVIKTRVQTQGCLLDGGGTGAGGANPSSSSRGKPQQAAPGNGGGAAAGAAQTPSGGGAGASRGFVSTAGTNGSWNKGATTGVGAAAGAGGMGQQRLPGFGQQLAFHSSGGRGGTVDPVRYRGLLGTGARIFREEGLRAFWKVGGFFHRHQAQPQGTGRCCPRGRIKHCHLEIPQGAMARAFIVVPGGAVSWASYEMVKSLLVQNF